MMVPLSPSASPMNCEGCEATEKSSTRHSTNLLPGDLGDLAMGLSSSIGTVEGVISLELTMTLQDLAS